MLVGRLAARGSAQAFRIPSPCLRLRGFVSGAPSLSSPLSQKLTYEREFEERTQSDLFLDHASHREMIKMVEEAKKLYQEGDNEGAQKILQELREESVIELRKAYAEVIELGKLSGKEKLVARMLAQQEADPLLRAQQQSE
eukprot:c18028_g1_i1.p1 GENE.c18028_g1_i1~~c18028_g1_i1.p1  ORF type:complete len:141 (+),score=29.10 c18028_g1_i1:24-446(+)